METLTESVPLANETCKTWILPGFISLNLTGLSLVPKLAGSAKAHLQTQDDCFRFQILVLVFSFYLNHLLPPSTPRFSRGHVLLSSLLTMLLLPTQKSFPGYFSATSIWSTFFIVSFFALSSWFIFYVSLHVCYPSPPPNPRFLNKGTLFIQVIMVSDVSRIVSAYMRQSINI